MSEFRYELPVRFADVDHAQIVYYPQFFHYFHVAFEELFSREYGAPYAKVLEEEHVGFPTVRTECDYRSPVRYGDVLTISIATERMGGKSLTLRYRATCRGRDEASAEARITTACVDMRSFTGRPIPDRFRELFARFQVEAS